MAEPDVGKAQSNDPENGGGAGEEENRHKLLGILTDNYDAVFAVATRRWRSTLQRALDEAEGF